jgi:hypothetical protein
METTSTSQEAIIPEAGLDTNLNNVEIVLIVTNE